MYIKKIVLLFFLGMAPSFAQEMTLNQTLSFWTERFDEATPSYSFDYEIEKWGAENRLVFEFVDPSSELIPFEKYLFRAWSEKFKVKADEWDCEYHFLVFDVWLNEFKQSTVTKNVTSEPACNDGRI